MRAVGISNTKVTSGMLSSIDKQQKSQANKSFKEAAVKRTLANETIRKTLNLLSKV